MPSNTLFPQSASVRRLLPLTSGGWFRGGWSRLVLAILLAGACVAGASCARRTTDRDIRFVTTAEVERLRGKPSIVLIDPRSPSAFERGHISGAINMQIADINPDGKRLKRLKDADSIIVYGQDPASAPARGMTKRLLAAGYSRAKMYSGGLSEWTARGLPVESATE